VAAKEVALKRPGRRPRDLVFFYRTYPHLWAAAVAEAKRDLPAGKSLTIAARNRVVKGVMKAQGFGFYEQMIEELKLRHDLDVTQYNREIEALQSADPTAEQWAQLVAYWSCFVSWLMSF
jgi:hypothetical protein